MYNLHDRPIADTKKTLGKGTCYFEFCIGKFTGKYWMDDSLYLYEDSIELIEALLIDLIPDFDFYSETVLDKSAWKNFISELKKILQKIKAAKNYTELDEAISLDKHVKESYAEKFEEMKNYIHDMLQEIVNWSQTNEGKSPYFSILGI